jgi:hypothetical protein
MTEATITPETFKHIAANVVDKYLAEVTARHAGGENKPSFEELYGTLKTLNAELTVKAIKLIKTLHRQHVNRTQLLVEEYQQIITSSVQVFVKQLN